MFPPDPSTSSGAGNMPPLPDLSGGGTPAPGGQSGLAGLLAGVGPIKGNVDMIQKACQAIVKSGLVPGSEQICGQIIALASSLVPMAVQSALGPGSGGGLPSGGPPPGPPGVQP